MSHSQQLGCHNQYSALSISYYLDTPCIAAQVTTPAHHSTSTNPAQLVNIRTDPGERLHLLELFSLDLPTFINTYYVPLLNVRQQYSE